MSGSKGLAIWSLEESITRLKTTNYDNLGIEARFEDVVDAIQAIRDVIAAES